MENVSFFQLIAFFLKMDDKKKKDEESESEEILENDDAKCLKDCLFAFSTCTLKRSSLLSSSFFLIHSQHKVYVCTRITTTTSTQNDNNASNVNHLTVEAIRRQHRVS